MEVENIKYVDGILTVDYKITEGDEETRTATYDAINQVWLTSKGRRLKSERGAELTQFIEDQKKVVINSLKIADLELAEANIGLHSTENRRTSDLAVLGASALLFGAVGVYGAFQYGNSLGHDAGHDEGFSIGYEKGVKISADKTDNFNLTHYLNGKKAGAQDVLNHSQEWGNANVSLGMQAAADAAMYDLEQRISNSTKWDSDRVSATAKNLFNNTNIDDFNFHQLESLYGQLMFDAGALSTPAAENATVYVTHMINTTFGVPNENLANLDLFSAVITYGQLSAFEAESAVRELAGTWNASWYQQGKDEILKNAVQWKWESYMDGKKAGAQDILNQTPTWGKQNYTAGYAVSLAEVLGVVDDVLTAAEISGANNNITKLLELYSKKVADQAYDQGLQNMRLIDWMNDKTAPYLAKQNASARNDSISLWTKNVDVYPTTAKKQGWSYLTLNDKLNATVSLKLYNNANITNDTKTYILNAINAGDMVYVLDTANEGNDVVNGSFIQRYTNNRVSDDGIIVSDIEYGEIFADVKGG